MKELLFVCTLAVIIVSGYFMMKKLDIFLEDNRRLIDSEIAENSLFIAFDNPVILDSLISSTEDKFSRPRSSSIFKYSALVVGAR